MALKQCDKCSEMVAEAKAFCPGCGHAFVEEETRKTASNFDTMDHTVQLGQTMYNQMLSDMGLKTSKSASSTEKRVEVVPPVATVVKPAVPALAKQKPSSNKKWFMLAGIAVVLLFLLVLAIAAAIFIYWSRFIR